MDIKQKKYILLAALLGSLTFLFFSSAALATVTISGTSITGDSSFNAISGTASTTIDLGAGQTLFLQKTNNGPVNSGNGLFTISGPLTTGGAAIFQSSLSQSGGNVLLGPTTITGAATTTNLSVTGLASAGNPCLVIGSTGVVATSTCASGSGITSLAGLSNAAITLNGTANQLLVATSGPGTITLSLPQNINNTAEPTFAGLTINGVATATNLSISGLSSSGNPCLTIGATGTVATSTCASASGITSLAGLSDSSIILNGTSNQLIVATSGPGTITLSLPQNIDNTATPYFGGLLINGVATATNLTISGLGSTGNPCLNIGATGIVATTTCASGSVTTSGGPAQYQTTVFSGSSALTGVALGSSGQVLTSNGAGAYPTYQTIPGIALNGLLNPTGSASYTMGGNQLTFSGISLTGTQNFLTVSDLAGNSSTGYGLDINLTSGSTMKPARLAVNSVGVAISNAGVLAATGGGHVNADQVNGAAYPAATTTSSIPVITAANVISYQPLPNCTDISGNHLNFATTTNTFSCGTSSSGGGGTPTIAGLTASTFVLNGTANQLLVATSGPGTITLSLPQSIAAASSPTFAGLTVSGIATTTNLVISGLGSSGSPCLTINTSGVVATSTCSGSFSAGGDLSGTGSSQTVVGLQGVSLATTTPTNGQLLAYNSTTGMWTPTTGSGGSVATVNGASGTVVITTTGTANQIDVSGGTGTTPTVSLDSNITFPGSVTVSAANGSFTDQPYVPFYNTSENTDKLTSNGAMQYFSMNSGVAQIPANQLITGKRVTINYMIDIITGSSGTNQQLRAVFCTVSGCGSGTIVQLAANSASTISVGNNTTMGDILSLTCVGTAAAGSTATILCAPHGRSFAGWNNNQSMVIANVPTNGILYINMGYNQVTGTGNSDSMMGSWATWDTN